MARQERIVLTARQLDRLRQQELKPGDIDRAHKEALIENERLDEEGIQAAVKELQRRQDAARRGWREKEADGGRPWWQYAAVVAAVIILVLLFWGPWPKKKVVVEVTKPPEAPVVVVPKPEGPKEARDAEQMFAGRKLDVSGTVQHVHSGEVKVKHGGSVNLSHSGEVKIKKEVKHKKIVVSEPHAKAVPLPSAAPPTPVPSAPVVSAERRPVLPRAPIGPCKVKYGPEWKVRWDPPDPSTWDGKRPLVEWAYNPSKNIRIKRIHVPVKGATIERLLDNTTGYAHDRIRDDVKCVSIERIREPKGESIHENIRDEVKGGTLNRIEEGGYLTTLLEDANGIRPPERVPIVQAKPEKRARPPRLP